MTVAVNYEDNDALAARAGLLARLTDELAADTVEQLPFDPTYTASATLRELDRGLFEVTEPRVEPDGGLALLECGGERGEAEAVAGEIATLLARGVAPDDVVVVLRRPEARGALYDQVLGGLRIPVAVEASVPLPHTAVGQGVVALGRCSSPDAGADDLLEFLRARPGNEPQSIADDVERRARREAIRDRDRGHGGMEGVATRTSPGSVRHASPRRGCASSRRPPAGSPRIRTPARSPWISSADRPSGEVPFEPLEVRAAEAAASTLEELADLERLPGCDPPAPAEALEALEDVRVPLWRGPTDGRVRVLSPYRVRAARARHLFLASLQDGEFPGPEVVDPLLGEERRRRLGIGALTRRDPALEERYLFHACVARPTERLWLSWRSSDEEGRPAARSPFVDDVLDLLAPDAEEAEARLKQVHGLDRVVFAPEDAPSRGALDRALAAVGPRFDPVLPGPLASPRVLAELAERNPVGAGTIEKWIECPYRWFVDHELEAAAARPPAGSRSRPGRSSTRCSSASTAIRRETIASRAPATWTGGGRGHVELLAEAAAEHGLEADRPLAGVALARMRAQIERLLERESRSETDSAPPPASRPRSGMATTPSKPALHLGDLALHGHDRSRRRHPRRALRGRLRLQDVFEGDLGREAGRGGQAPAPALRAGDPRPMGDRAPRRALLPARGIEGPEAARLRRRRRHHRGARPQETRLHGPRPGRGDRGGWR